MPVSPFVIPTASAGSIFGGGTAGAVGFTTGQPVTGQFGAFGQQPTMSTSTVIGISTGGSAFGQPQQQELATATGASKLAGTASASSQAKPASGSGMICAQPSRTITLECIEELLRKFLLGEELVNTQFHLFSTRSSSSARVTKPRVLCVNNWLLAKSSKYFLEREWLIHRK